MPISHPLSLLGLLSASAAVRIGRGKKVLEVVRRGVEGVRENREFREFRDCCLLLSLSSLNSLSSLCYVLCTPKVITAQQIRKRTCGA